MRTVCYNQGRRVSAVILSRNIFGIGFPGETDYCRVRCLIKKLPVNSGTERIEWTPPDMSDSSCIETLMEEISLLEAQLTQKKKELSELVLPEPVRLEDVTKNSSSAWKIALFRSLFRGREDVYAKQYWKKNEKKPGYAPACSHEWEYGICRKPKVKCALCDARKFIPLTDITIYHHLKGEETSKNGKAGSSFALGLYPLLPDETCFLLASDFDKDTWEADVSAVMMTCREEGIPSAFERSRSGNGGHL